MAEASDGQLVELSNGLTREQIAEPSYRLTVTRVIAAKLHDDPDIPPRRSSGGATLSFREVCWPRAVSAVGLTPRGA